MHGGAAGSGAPRSNRNALRHGGRSAEAVALRRLASGLAREARRLAAMVG
jgi:glucans biosynthesis protein